MSVEKTLSPKQLKAIDLLAIDGRTAKDVAQELEVHENTINFWLNREAYTYFQDAYYARLEEAKEVGRKKLLRLTTRAVDQLEEITFGTWGRDQIGQANVRLKGVAEILDRVGVVKGSKTSVSFDGLSDEELIRQAAGIAGGNGTSGIDALPSVLPSLAEPLAQDR